MLWLDAAPATFQAPTFEDTCLQAMSSTLALKGILDRLKRRGGL